MSILAGHQRKLALQAPQDKAGSRVPNARNAIELGPDKLFISGGAANSDFDEIVVFSAYQIRLENLGYLRHRDAELFQGYVVMPVEHDFDDNRFAGPQKCLVEDSGVAGNYAVVFQPLYALPAWACRQSDLIGKTAA